MKKLSYFFFGAAALLMASCSQEDVVSPAGDGNVLLTIAIPDGVATRAAAIGSGEAAVNLQYAVYELSNVDGETQYSLVYNDTEEGFFSAGMSNTLSLDLIKGKEYKVAFFAESAKAASVYSFDPDAKTLSVDYSEMVSDQNNEDDYDCFLNTWDSGVVGAAISGKVLLYRPVAQINWGSSDLGSPLVGKAYGQNGANIWTTLSISNAPQTLNFLTGDISNEDKVEIGPFAIPSGNVKPGFPYVGMQYVLTSNSSANYDLSLTIANAQTSPTETVTVPVTNVPLQANYQTNIYGTLLTNQANLTIDLNPGFNIPENNIIDGAIVEFTADGTVECITPTLPTGVTPELMEQNEAGAVAISADGTPVYFAPTGKAIASAMQEYSELYFAPNTTITTTSHALVVPQSGITIHGNGATITGQEQDFSIDEASNHMTYENGSTININIYNLNGVKVWGATNAEATFNINLTNCTLTGKGLDNGSLSLIMTRGSDNSRSIANITLNNCYAQNTKVAIHSTYVGTLVVNNCTFKGVGIPVNYAKKLAGKNAEVTVTGCLFTDCGISPEDTSNDAYDYAAPVRVVDNAGPKDTVTVLVDNCTFEDTQSEWDILLMDYRSGKTWFPVEYSITNCTPANPTLRVN